MQGINFNFCGKLKKIKTDKFKTDEIKAFSSGWCTRTYKFAGQAKSSRYMFNMQFGYWGDSRGNLDEAKNVIYTFAKRKEGETKSAQLKIPYAKRFDEETIKDVARRYYLDTNPAGDWFEISNIVAKFEKNEAVSDESKDKYKVYNLVQAKAEQAKLAENRKEFICYGDFVDAINEIVESGKYENEKWSISGNWEIAYSEEKGQFYKNFVPTRVSRAKDDAEEHMRIIFDAVYGDGAWNEEYFADTGKCYLDAYVEYYDGRFKDINKGKVFCPMHIAFNIEDDEAKNYIGAKFDGHNPEVPYHVVGLVCDYINGAERIEITEDDLTDEQRKDIAYGYTTFEDIKRALGGSAYGEKITEIRFVKYDNTVYGHRDTVYTDSDIEPPHHEENAVVKETISTGEDDIFEI